jgi:flavin-dependent dehydrogenase
MTEVSLKTDVAILGGGLAGLTLALQLRRSDPHIDVVIVERRRHPVPEAAHKVGESSVEIAAHYFSEVLGLTEHLMQKQLKKFGFRFFFSEGAGDLAQVLEVGASSFFPTPTYQIDRGIFENFLGARVREDGVRFLDGTSVRTVEFGGEGCDHLIACERGGEPLDLRARWVVDATGRAGVLKRQLGLAQSNEHDVNSAWFRLAARIDVNEWSNDLQWRARCNPPNRWLSTNHLVGEGYWVWLIPLASGSHSVGIVADPRIHPLDRMNSFSRALEWLHEFQPRLAQEVEAKRDTLQDFVFFKNFSYSCKQVFSGDRWALTGEAGVFLDPFYSPGSDFIAISNTYVTELILQERSGRSVHAHARIYEQLFMSFYESTMSLYQDQYRIFGDPQVLPVKIVWDYTYYWGVLCQLFFQGRLTDISLLGRVRDELMAIKSLNFAMQDFLREWSQRSGRRENLPGMLDQTLLPWFMELNRGLRDRLDADGLVARLDQTAAQLRRLAHDIVDRASGTPGLDPSRIMAALAGRGHAAEPMLLDSAA